MQVENKALQAHPMAVADNHKDSTVKVKEEVLKPEEEEKVNKLKEMLEGDKKDTVTDDVAASADKLAKMRNEAEMNKKMKLRGMALQALNLDKEDELKASEKVEAPTLMVDKPIVQAPAVETEAEKEVVTVESPKAISEEAGISVIDLYSTIEQKPVLEDVVDNHHVHDIPDPNLYQKDSSHTHIDPILAPMINIDTEEPTGGDWIDLVNQEPVVKASEPNKKDATNPSTAVNQKPIAKAPIVKKPIAKEPVTKKPIAKAPVEVKASPLKALKAAQKAAKRLEKLAKMNQEQESEVKALRLKFLKSQKGKEGNKLSKAVESTQVQSNLVEKVEDKKAVLKQ